MDTAYRVTPLRNSDPNRLGHYELVGRLGAGGMGVVYLGTDPDGEYVAVKVIHAALATDPEYAARFRSEVRRAEQVPSFCTARFLDADLDHDPPYLVTEYIDGPSLTEVVADEGLLQAGDLHSLAVGMATALAGIHGAGVIHRDLKPGNVLLPSGSTKVIDFGIARPVEATSQLTAPHGMVGTVSYMAPERLAGAGTVTAAADIFSWGCVVTYAGTGHRPFEGDSTSATASKILTQPPDLTGLPHSLAKIVAHALAKEPADRPTAQQLLAMLVGSADTVRIAAPDPLDEPTGVRPPTGTAADLQSAGVPEPGPAPVDGDPAPAAIGPPPAPQPRHRRTGVVLAIAAAVVVVLLLSGLAVNYLVHQPRDVGNHAGRSAGTTPSVTASAPNPSATASRHASVHQPASPSAGAGDGQTRPSASRATPAGGTPVAPTVITSNVGKPVTIGRGGKCMDVNTNTDKSGNAVQLWDCNGTTGQQWTFGSDGKLHAFDKCLDIIAESTTPGTKLQLWDCYDSGAQAWQQRSDGTIFNPNSKLCLDDPSGNTANGTQLQIWNCNGLPPQKWSVS